MLIAGAFEPELGPLPSVHAENSFRHRIQMRYHLQDSLPASQESTPIHGQIVFELHVLKRLTAAHESATCIAHSTIDMVLLQVRHPNCYGIDLPRQSELLAFGLDENEIAEAIGADGVVFQVRSKRGTPPIRHQSF